MKKTFFWAMLALLLTAVGCGGGAQEINQTFDSAGSWAVGGDQAANATVADGTLTFRVSSPTGFYWSDGGYDLGHGTYEIEATQISGPLDNGFGLMFFISEDEGDFIMFEISGDGFLWIGRCAGNCEDDLITFTEGGWVESDAVRDGLNQTNHLRVVTSPEVMSFYVNDELVYEGTDTTLSSGDVGVLIETLGVGGVGVSFDNFKFTPAGSGG